MGYQWQQKLYLSTRENDDNNPSYRNENLVYINASKNRYVDNPTQ